MQTFDYYCQQVSLPYSSQQRGTFYFRTPHKVQVFGVCCEATVSPSVFLIDEAEQVSKGAVAVVSLVHAFFHLHRLGERHVTLQADNCVGQNKNTTMLWYLAWRVIIGQHNRIQLNFMLPGHTKFFPTPTLACSRSNIADRITLTTSLTWPTASISAARTSHVCHCCARTGSFMIGTPSWASSSGLWLALDTTTCLCLTESTPVLWTWSRWLPILIKMPQSWAYWKLEWRYRLLSAPSDAYSFKARWLACQLNGHSTFTTKLGNMSETQGRGTTCVQSLNLSGDVRSQDQLGPSTAIPGPSTAEGHKSDDSFSWIQDEDKGRKRRWNSELNLVYKCPMCTKTHAGYSSQEGEA